MRSEIVVAGENGKEAAEPSVLMMQAVHHHHHHPQDPCSRSVIIHPPTQQQQQQVADPPAGMFAPPLPIQNTSSLERREFREPELDIGLFFWSNQILLFERLKKRNEMETQNRVYCPAAMLSYWGGQWPNWRTFSSSAAERGLRLFSFPTIDSSFQTRSSSHFHSIWRSTSDARDFQSSSQIFPPRVFWF